MRRPLDQIFKRSFKALAGSVEMLGQRVRGRQRVDGIVSRIAHTLSRAPANERKPKDEVGPEAVSERETVDDIIERDFSRPPELPVEVRTNRTGHSRSKDYKPFVERRERKAEKEEEHRDTDLNDDMLKLVRYKILFVKRGYEVAFTEKEEFVTDNVTGKTFSGWKLAEFAQHLDKIEIPRTWREKGYPTPNDQNGTDGMIHSLPEEDKKFLRVSYEVMARYTRNKLNHRKRQLDVLEDIRKAITNLGSKGQ